MDFRNMERQNPLTGRLLLKMLVLSRIAELSRKNFHHKKICLLLLGMNDQLMATTMPSSVFL